MNQFIHTYRESGFHKKKLFLIMIPVLVFLIVLIFYLAITSYQSRTAATSQAAESVQTPAPTYKTVIVGDVQVRAEVADTQAKRWLGLGGRDSLGEFEGMLFSYEQKSPAVFWMRGMRFPIDIIWVADGKVIQIDEYAMPEPGVSDNNLKKYIPHSPVEYVLEVNGGFSQRNNISVGDSFSVN